MHAENWCVSVYSMLIYQMKSIFNVWRIRLGENLNETLSFYLWMGKQLQTIGYIKFLNEIKINFTSFKMSLFHFYYGIYSLCMCFTSGKPLELAKQKLFFCTL